MTETKNNVFYVDDDEDDLNLFQIVIDEIGGNVTLFQTGVELLNAMNAMETKPTIVFVDLNMPYKSGFDVLEEIKSSPAFNDIPVVILSTANDPVTFERCRKSGADYYMCKMYSYSEINIALQHVFKIDWDNPPPDFVFCEEHLN